MEFFLLRISSFQTFAIKAVELSKAFEAVCRNCDKIASDQMAAKPCSYCKGKKRIYEDAESGKSRNGAETH